jgi:hypothetical protein
MIRLNHLYAFVILLAGLAACQPGMETPTVPPGELFPTVTPGRSVRGVLSTPDPSLRDGLSISNPATIAALASQPTATPDSTACPALSSDAELPRENPVTAADVENEIVRYLSSGGSISSLEATLREGWELLGDDSFLRTDLDLTGEGIAEIVVGYTTPEGSGVLLILGCLDGRYVLHYQAVSDEPSPPEIFLVGDVNRDGFTNLAFTSRVCASQDSCSYRTHLITWRPEVSRIVSLLGTTIISDTPPDISDIDNDGVGEIVVRLTNTGTQATGPLRTGVNIYDWNGSVYVLSIVQLDPPRFRIQIIHEADRQFAQSNYNEAIELYALALEDDALRLWFSDELPILQSYALYRLMLTYAAAGQVELFPIYQQIVESFPDPENQPVFAAIGAVFWEGFQLTNDLEAACLRVQRIIETQPKALELLNRYGSRSPTYSAHALCPF